uniref:Uncharacterized protein n=1 Tax=Oryza sativa subsp. japonica TaxID=39947 RepID=Q2QUW9_ORYSJ|nr:hypothetical protein LOC_Os12g14830 [Oryza sativa Japonica Group]
MAGNQWWKNSGGCRPKGPLSPWEPRRSSRCGCVNSKSLTTGIIGGAGLRCGWDVRLLRSVQSRAKEDLAIHVSQRGCSSTICQIRWQAIDLALRLSPVDLAAQSLASTEDSELARRLRGPAVAVGKRLSFMNEYLAEDRDPFRINLSLYAAFLVTALAQLPDSEIPESAEADPEPECDYPQREGEHLSI